MTRCPDDSVPDDSVPDDSTTTTEPPPATQHPDGWVDAGHGVFVPPVLLQIRYCESTDNYTAANPSSSARGAYQFLRGSWAAYGHADRYGVSEAHLASPAQQDEARPVDLAARRHPPLERQPALLGVGRPEDGHCEFAWRRTRPL